MSALIKILFSVLTKIAFAACGEVVIKMCIFKMLHYAAEHSKTHFDDKLLTQIENAYEDREKANA